MLSLMRQSCSRLKISRIAAYSTVADGGLPDMPACDFTPPQHTGINYEDSMKIRKEKLHPNLLTYYRKPILVTDGHMQWLFDDNGRQYLDLFAGIVTVSVGHCHPKVVGALEKQIKKLWHTTSIYLHPNIHEYAEKLTSRLPEHLKVVYFVNSGSEANDLAMTMARLHTGVQEITVLLEAARVGN
ncbi:alanine--glyoxylate aminotransferase 2, mitochondrial-like [Saccoglossus kowalevskii]